MSMEFTIAQIRDFAGTDEIYQKAEELVKNKSIVSLDIDDFSRSDIILINATIQDHKKYVEVNMSVDKDDYLVKAHMCTCHDHKENLMPCAHCCAVLLKIFSDSKPRPALTPTSASKVSDNWAYQLIHSYENTIVYSSLAMNLNQKVHIEPVLEIRKNEIVAVTCKVGTTRQYIIKDLSGFLDDIKHNVRKRYGKELEFLHHRNSFDAPSQLLLDFLTDHQNDTFYFSNTYRYRNCPEPKNLCLTPHALDEFFTLYQGCDVMYRIREKTLINMKFVDSDPPLHIEVSKNNHLYKIAINDTRYLIFRGSKAMYVLYRHCLYRCTKDYSEHCLELLSTVQKKQDALYLSQEHMPIFYNNVIMSIKEDLPILGTDISEFAPLPLVCRLFLDLPQPECISLQLMYCYGMQEYNAFSTDSISTGRNFNDEIAVRLILSRYMTRVDAAVGLAYIENSQDAIYDFLNHGIQELSEHCEIYVSDLLKAIEVKNQFHISMGVRMEANLLEIDFDTYDFPIDELVDVLKAYRLNKKYYRMKDGNFVNLEDSALSELSMILESMHVKDNELSEGKLKVDSFRSLYLDQVMKQSGMIQSERDSSFKNIIRNIHNFEDSDYQIPPNLNNTLRNYQKTGFRWLKTMAAYGFGGILADDMGIGKTIQVIALLQDEKAHHKNYTSLVVCPSSLLLNWQNEINKFSDHLSSLIIAGNQEERKVLLHSYADYDVIITSYDYLKRDVESYQSITFAYHILDEAQYIKNHATKNAQSVKQIHSLHKIALTGTPIENSLAELWSIFDFLMPGYLYDYQYFKGIYEIPIVKDNDVAARRKLRKMVEPFILRRVKKDVLKELPEKVENTLLIDMDEDARKLYMANVALIRNDLQAAFVEKGLNKSRIMVLSMLTRLRQFCCDPRLIYENYSGESAKLKACMELIENCMQAEKKILLFSQFTSLLSLIEDELNNRGIPYYLLKGSTPKVQRQHLVNAFNSNDIPIFLISLKAGGTGLNLASAEVVIHYDPWWNISAQNQATDRAYRIGQHNNVQVFKLIAKDTIEERIMRLQDQKKDLGDSIIRQNDGTITNMTQEEILNLF